MDLDELRQGLLEVLEAVQEGRVPTPLTPTNILLSDEEFFSEADLPMLQQLLREELDLQPHGEPGVEAECVGGREDVQLYVYRSEGEGVVYFLLPEELDIL